MRISLFAASATLCIVGSLFSQVNAKAILGVDLGTLYMKVALVKRGAPLEIVTNLHSKRKTEQMILFDQGTRFYGADANGLLARKPTKTPVTMSIVLGRDDEHPTVKVLSERHYPLIPKYNATRFGSYFVVDGKEEYTPEELTAMVLNHAEEITIAYGKEKGHDLGEVRDCVLTVPSFATQAERRAYLDAAKLGNFNVLSLIDENTASALNFGMDKMYEEPQTILFYNLGASSLQVSVIKFHSYEMKEGKYSKKTKTVGSIEVLGKAWDSTLGGLAFDNRLVEYLADHFNAEWNKARGHTKDIRTIPRAMTKLRIQANKIKHVLSANMEIPVHMDSLHDDMSLSLHITRAKFEELCEDLMDRAVAPVHEAIKSAGLELKDITAIEMIGGGMRVPKVRAGLSAALDDKELGMHINSDESMALGAAFFGANISTAFRVRHVGLTDINPFPIAVSLAELEAKKPKKGEEVWGKEATIFASNGKTGVKKSIAFTHDQDLHCSLDYAEADGLPEGSSSELQRYKISGVAAFAKEMEEKGLGKPKVTLQFELTHSGITELVKAEAAVIETYTVEEEVEVEDEEEGDDKKEETEGEDEKKEEETTDEDKDNETKTEEEEKPKKKTKLVEKEKKRTIKKTLEVESYFVGKIRPLNEELMAESKAKLDYLAQKDKERVLLEEAKNRVESYIYLIKNKLNDDEENIVKVSTEEQREELRKLSADGIDWLDDEGYNADLATMEAKYTELSEPSEKVWFRVKEMTARPAAVKALTKKLDKVEELMMKWKDSMPQITEEEKADVTEKVTGVRTWLTEKEAEQEKLESHEEPAFSSAEVPLQTKSLERLISKLLKKPKPKPVKKEKNETATEGNETDATEGNETDAKAEDAEETDAKAEDAEEKDAEASTEEEAKEGEGETKEETTEEGDAKAGEEL
mmetsp:Transcript_40066/g.96730  ORF Transcript_40066/g.96730 Transcript_40066/m.96730 type:complete len:923 (+) Transcript_40066:162-2930(+)|eukprot:CAMPEP_0113608394 /NCGR_PEP_ID=MMETSP0017_2-20120614/3906_1 /TAXON_ID=2856 /ORGANISM="Cylindrotheca closterium" /LENGTH=922 /DNA_ID=CAMNT_0000517085 /DNA_START=153 /DNA_END=2921 /DNA_ORIENTATION=+ /assembly_acc=CAM_ASM_000147